MPELLQLMPGLGCDLAHQRLFHLRDPAQVALCVEGPWSAGCPNREGGPFPAIQDMVLAARGPDVVRTVPGATFGMMPAKAPAVALRDRTAQMVSTNLVHGLAAAVVAVPGMPMLPDGGRLI